MITRVTVYRTKGEQFDTPEKAIQHVIDRRRELIDLLSYDDEESITEAGV